MFCHNPGAISEVAKEFKSAITPSETAGKTPWRAVQGLWVIIESGTTRSGQSIEGLRLSPVQGHLYGLNRGHVTRLRDVQPCVDATIYKHRKTGYVR